MKVLILSQWFNPERGHLLHGLATSLMEMGHEVEVLTGLPYHKSGKFYDGYRVRPLVKETFDGVPILRVPLYPSHDRSGIRRTLTYASFAVAASIIGPFAIRKPDVVYVYHPPATNGLPARMIRFLRRVPFVYHIQDLWPDTLPATGMVNSAAIINLLDRWCKQVYRRAQQLIVLSPGFRRALLERGVPEEKIHVIYNWGPEVNGPAESPDPMVVDALNQPGQFNILYAGNLGKAQALESVIDAARLLIESHPKIRFVFVGDGVEADKLQRYASECGVHNVLFLPRQSQAQMRQVYELADALLVHLKNDPLFEITIPSKTQAYLSVGKPILMAVRGDAADLVAQSGAGICCEPQASHSIAQAAIRLYEMSPEERAAMGELGRRFYDAKLSMREGTQRIAEVLERAITEYSVGTKNKHRMQ